MNLVEDKIVHLLTGKRNLYEVTVDELQAISDEQPFFSVAQLLLTQKMKQVNHPEFVQQLQKTALFFPNIFWLDKHLQEVPQSDYQRSSPETVPAPIPEPLSEPVFQEASAPLAEPATSSSPSYYGTEEDDTELNPIAAQYHQPAVSEPETVKAEPEQLYSTTGTNEISEGIDEPVTEQKTEASVAAEWELPAGHITEPEPVTATYVTPEPETADIPPVEDVVITPAEKQPDIEEADYIIPAVEEEDFVQQEQENQPNVQELANADAPVDEIATENAPAPATEPLEETVAEEQVSIAAIEAEATEAATEFDHAVKESFAAAHLEQTESDEDALPVDAIGETEDTDNTPNLRLAEMMQQQAASFHQPVAADAVVPIQSEPYHTIDYFASQGIRAEGSEDGLTKKVRRFTDWLKQMKKVATHPSDLGTDAELEKVVHGIAATSIEAKEVVTEAMADILVKQGKIDKAVLMYSKLSFLNPDKTAYFAAKILELKGN